MKVKKVLFACGIIYALFTTTSWMLMLSSLTDKVWGENNEFLFTLGAQGMWIGLAIAYLVFVVWLSTNIYKRFIKESE